MPHFEITLKNEKIKSYKRSLAVIIFLNLITFLFLVYVSKGNESRKTALLAAECIAISLLLDVLIKNKIRIDFRFVAILLSLFFYFKLHYYWLVIALAIIMIFYFLAIRISRVYVSDQNILYQNFLKKIISWNQLDNLILKDGLLSIDFKNNKLIQLTIDESKNVINEQEFNDFCRQQLNK